MKVFSCFHDQRPLIYTKQRVIFLKYYFYEFWHGLVSLRRSQVTQLTSRANTVLCLRERRCTVCLSYDLYVQVTAQVVEFLCPWTILRSGHCDIISYWRTLLKTVTFSSQEGIQLKTRLFNFTF